MALDAMSELKLILREDACPFFDDPTLLYYLEKNGQSIDSTAHECLILKAENTSLNVSGLTCEDTSKYFKMLAKKYRQTNSGILQGG